MSFKLNNGEVFSFADGDTKYALAKLLVAAMDELGHPPAFNEARAFPRMPEDTNLYAVYFGSLAKACEQARYVVVSKENPESVRVKHTMSRDERAVRTREFQAELIRKQVEKSNEVFRRWKMEKREEIMERVMQLCFEHGNSTDWINDNAVKRDPILVHKEIIQVFGSVKALKKEARRRLWEEKHGRKFTKDATREVAAVDSGAEAVDPAVDVVETEAMANVATDVVADAVATEEPVKEVAKVAGRKKRKSDEELWAEVRAKAEELGRPATDKEIAEDDALGAAATYYRRLGSDYKHKLAGEAEGGEPEVSAELEVKGPEAPVEESDASVEEPSTPAEEFDAKESGSALQIEEVATETGEMLELPIKVILPKGIKGTIQLTLEF